MSYSSRQKRARNGEGALRQSSQPGKPERKKTKPRPKGNLTVEMIVRPHDPVTEVACSELGVPYGAIDVLIDPDLEMITDDDENVIGVRIKGQGATVRSFETGELMPQQPDGSKRSSAFISKAVLKAEGAARRHEKNRELVDKFVPTMAGDNDPLARILDQLDDAIRKVELPE